MNTSMIDYQADGADKSPKHRYNYHGSDLEIPDMYWDREHETVNIPAMLKSAIDMRKKVSVHGKAPKTYELRLPKDLDAKRQIDENAPLVRMTMDWARKNNLSQEAFDELVESFVRQEDEALDPERFRALQQDALKEKLGHRCDEVCREVGHWFGGLMHQDFADQPELREAAEELASDARGVLLLKAIRDRLTERGVPDNRQSGKGQLDEAALRRMQGTEAYMNSRHPDHDAVARRVREGWQALVGSRKD